MESELTVRRVTSAGPVQIVDPVAAEIAVLAETARIAVIDPRVEVAARTKTAVVSDATDVVVATGSVVAEAVVSEEELLVVAVVEAEAPVPRSRSIARQPT